MKGRISMLIVPDPPVVIRGFGISVPQDSCERYPVPSVWLVPDIMPAGATDHEVSFSFAMSNSKRRGE